MIVRLCPLAKPSFDSLPKRTYTLGEEKEWDVHGLPFSWDLEAVILPQNEIIGRGIERMCYSASTGWHQLRRSAGWAEPPHWTSVPPNPKGRDTTSAEGAVGCRVEAVVAHRPPHRPGREQFAHPVRQ